MKISCTQENLNQGLFIVSHLAAKSAALPILNNILIQASENLIKLSATNLEIGVTCGVRGKVEEEGDFTVQSKLFADYVSLLPKDRVDLTVDKNQENNQNLEVKCKNHATKIKGQLAADFPLIPQINKTNPYVVDYQKFRQAISQVIFAVSISETRPEISGVFFNFTKNQLILAATDSYRLAEKKIDLDKKNKDEEKKFIVPARALQELQRILGSFKDPAAISEIEFVEIYLGENQILFRIDSVELISRLVEGQYPDYQQIIPQTANTKITANTAELIKAIKAASLFARSGIYDVSLEVNPDKKIILISAANSQLGENRSEISAEITGENNATVVNFRYLLDGLQNIDSEEILINIIDGNGPCLIQTSEKSVDYLYIIMPIKQ